MHKILSILFSISFGLVAMYGLAQNPEPHVYIRFGDAKSGTLIVTNADYFASADDLYTVTTNLNAFLVPITNDLYALRFQVNIVTNQINNITNMIDEVDYANTLVYSEEGGFPHYYMRKQPTDLLQPLIGEMPYLKTNNLYDTTAPMPSISWSDTSGDLNFKNAPLNISDESTSLSTYIDYTGLYFYGEYLPALGLYMGGTTPGVNDRLYLSATSVEAESLNIYGWLNTEDKLGDYDTPGLLMYSPYLESYYDTTLSDYVSIYSGSSSGIDLEYFKVAALGEVHAAINQLRTELPAEFVPAYYYNDDTSELYSLYFGYTGFEINAPVLINGSYSTHLTSNTVYLDDIPPYSLASVVLARENDSPAYNIFIEKNLDGTFDIVEDTNSWEP